MSRKTLVLFMHIVYEPPESPLEALSYQDAVLFPPVAISLSLYDVLIINSSHQDSSLSSDFFLVYYTHFNTYSSEEFQ